MTSDATSTTEPTRLKAELETRLQFETLLAAFTRVPAAKTVGLLQALALTLLALCVPPASTASSAELANSGYLVRAWQTEDGLPSSSINDVVQTPDAYVGPHELRSDLRRATPGEFASQEPI